MNHKLVTRFLTAFLLIGAIAPIVEAAPPPPPPRPLIGDAVLRTSSPVVSIVNVVVHNPNPVSYSATLTLYVLQANGVPLTVPGGRIVVAPGFHTFTVYIRNEIAAVQWVRVTNLHGVI